jgi:hypothetical protein
VLRLAASQSAAPPPVQGGNLADLVGLDSVGAALGQVSVNGARNRDWEDLAAFTHDGNPHLLIADTGDNGGHAHS